MRICRLVVLDQQNLFLLISARITIYDIVLSDQAEIDLRGILIICRRDIDNMNWNHGKVEGYA